MKIECKNQNMARQIKMMLRNEDDPARQERRQGDNPGWETPLGCLCNARQKIGRVLYTDDRTIRLVGDDTDKVAEELREAAHYLLQGAALLALESDIAEYCDAVTAAASADDGAEPEPEPESIGEKIRNDKQGE